jgi:hypothetical protein
VDNVSLKYAPAQSAARTDCVDPLAPAATAGADGPELLVNGNFGTGTVAPWTLFGQIVGQVAGGVFEFYRAAPAADPAGVILQPTGAAFVASQIVTARFDLGNSSAVRKREPAHDTECGDRRHGLRGAGRIDRCAGRPHAWNKQRASGVG